MGSLASIAETHYAGILERDIEKSLSILAPDVATHYPGMPPMHGIPAFRGLMEAFMKAVPDMRLKAGRTHEDGDTVIIEGTFTGTQTGTLAGPGGDIPPSGRSFEAPFCDIFQIADQKVVSHRIYFDQLTFLQQLGIIPGPEGAGQG